MKWILHNHYFQKFGQKSSWQFYPDLVLRCEYSCNRYIISPHSSPLPPTQQSCVSAEEQLNTNSILPIVTNRYHHNYPIAHPQIPYLPLPHCEAYQYNILFSSNARTARRARRKDCTTFKIPSPPAHFLRYRIPHWSSSPLQKIAFAPKVEVVLNIAAIASSVATATHTQFEANLYSSPASYSFLAISQIYPYVSFTISLAFTLTVNARCMMMSAIFPSNRISGSLRHSPIVVSIFHQITASLIARTVSK